MGTYTQPTIITPNQTAGLIAGAEKGFDAVNKANQAAAAAKAKEDAARVKANRDKGKFRSKLYVDFNKSGDYSDVTIDQKYDTKVESLLSDLYYNYGDADSKEYNHRKDQVTIMAAQSAEMMGYFNKYGEVIDDMFMPPNNEGVRLMKPSSANGSNLLSNNDLDYDAMVDFRINHGAHGDFFSDGHTIGWDYQYMTTKNEEGDWEKISWDDYNKLKEEDGFQPGKYKEANHRIVANGIGDKIGPGGHIISGVNTEAYNTVIDDQWKVHGQGTYDRMGSKLRAGVSTKTTRTDSEGKTYQEETVSYEQARKAIRDSYMADVAKIPLDQNTWQSLGFDGKFENTQQQRIDAVEKMAQISIEKKGMFDRKTNLTKQQRQSQTQIMIDGYRSNNLPGLPSNFNWVGPSSNPNIVGNVNHDGAALLNGSQGIKPTNFPDAKFGSPEMADKYVYQDYANIASFYLEDGPQNGDRMREFSHLLNNMTVDEGGDYTYGNDFLKDLFTDDMVQRFINETGDQSGAMAEPGSNFYKWLSGDKVNGVRIDEEDIVYGVKNINRTSMYNRKGSYVDEIPINSSSAALNLLLNETSITNGEKNKLLSGFNTQQVNRAASGTSNQSFSTGTQSGTNTGTVNAPNIFSYDANTAMPVVQAGTSFNTQFTDADGKIVKLDVTPASDLIQMTGVEEDDLLAKYANFESTKGGPTGGALPNFGFSDAANKKLNDKFKQLGGDYNAYKTIIKEDIEPQAALDMGFVKDFIDDNGNIVLASDYRNMSSTEKAKYKPNSGNTDFMRQQVSPQVMASLNDWKFNAGRNTKDLSLAASLLDPKNKDAKKFMKMYDIDQTDIEKMINDNGSSFDIIYKDPTTDKEVSNNAAAVLKMIHNDEPPFNQDANGKGMIFEWEPKNLTEENIRVAKHALQGSDYASADKKKQKANKEKYLNTWQYRINL